MTKPENDGIPFELLCQQEYTFTQKLFLFNNGSVGFDRKYQDLCTDEFLARIVAHDGYFRMIGVIATGVNKIFWNG